MKNKISNYIEKLIARPEEERRQVALIASIVLTGLVIAGWITNIIVLNSLSGDQDLAVTAVPAADPNAPLTGWRKELSRVTDGFSVVGNYVKEIF
ncbi:MAG: hypothetical protein QG609_226 [Patescibacteria group bacterium]|nr:hypothetical protein [Patescibacteria group bacterium]